MERRRPLEYTDIDRQRDEFIKQNKDIFYKVSSNEIGSRVNEAPKEKKYISIFTKDRDSGKSIIKRLRDKNINQLQLHSNTHLNLFYSDSLNNEELTEFYKRLKDNSRGAHNRAIGSLTSML